MKHRKLCQYTKTCGLKLTPKRLSKDCNQRHPFSAFFLKYDRIITINNYNYYSQILHVVG